MCYYENYVWECQDFKWGNFRQKCHAEYRMGETCGGPKLVYDTYRLQGKCPMCQAIDKKVRRYEKARSDYTRWVNDPQRQASAAKALEDMNALYQDIQKMTADREARKRTNICNGRRDSMMRR